jgi:hypothetical protein
LFIEGDIYSLPANYNIEEDIVNFENNSEKYIEQAAQSFISDFIHEYNSDIFRFTEKTKKQFLTNKEFEEFKENVDYRDYQINVKADFKVRRTGLTVRD